MLIVVVIIYVALIVPVHMPKALRFWRAMVVTYNAIEMVIGI
jgi:hypothetical protein